MELAEKRIHGCETLSVVAGVMLRWSWLT